MSGMYGYYDDDNSSKFSFGLTAGKTYLKKFEYTPNGGKEGAAQEAFDIIFEIDGNEKSFRQFPVTKAFDKDGNEVTDPNSKEMQEEHKRVGALIVHILGCFIKKEDIKVALSRPFSDYKEYCNVITSLLPVDFSKKPLDIFMQWQWNITGENENTFLEFPKKMRHGRWLCASVPVKGTWVPMITKDAPDRQKDALYYVDSENEENIHPFIRNGWWMNSNYAEQQKEGETHAASILSATSNTSQTSVKTDEELDKELPFTDTGSEDTQDTPKTKKPW